MPLVIDLPDKPSDLLEVAINDFEKIAADSRYSIRMDVWHVPAKCTSDWQQANPTDRCQVCMAGAVMACRVVPIDQAMIPDDFDRKTHRKLEAIDMLRQGDFEKAFDLLGLDYPEAIEVVTEGLIEPEYSFDDEIDWSNPDDVAEYIAHYRRLINLLREKGY